MTLELEITKKGKLKLENYRLKEALAEIKALCDISKQEPNYANFGPYLIKIEEIIKRCEK